MKKNNNKGFTLAELLIVVAIIAVLTAIAIPVFTAQLHNSRARTDEANARSLYANLQADFLSKAGGTAAYTAASWGVSPGSYTGKGAVIPLQDQSSVKLVDDDTTITCALDPTKGWTVTFACTGNGINETWGASSGSGEGGGDTGGTT